MPRDVEECRRMLRHFRNLLEFAEGSESYGKGGSTLKPRAARKS